MFARFTFRKINSAASRPSSLVSNSNTLNKSDAKGNKWRPFKTLWLGKIALPKLPRSKRVLLAVLLLSSSAVALTSLGIRPAIGPAPNLAHGATSASPVNVASATVDAPLTKLREYVYAGGRLITSEEKSCVPTLSPAGASLPQGGGTGAFNVSTPSICDWTAASNADWITVTGGSSGIGNGTVSYSVTANGGVQRSGTISINGQAFTVAQAPNPSSCSYSLNKSGESISEQGGNGAFTLTTGTGCHWEASSNAGWLTISSATSGSGSAPITYSVAANAGQQRVGSISITEGGQTFTTFTVTQAPNQASCTFAINPSSNLIGAAGGNGSFNVMTEAGCRWVAATTAGWITIGGGSTGVDDGTVSFTVQANNGGSRTGTISVRGQVFTVTQCGYVISPTSAGVGRLGGAGSITVSAAAGCPWSAVSNVGWITIGGGSTGIGNGSVNYSVSEYPDLHGYREGTLTIAGQTVTIGQTGPQSDPPCCSEPPFCICFPEQLTLPDSSPPVMGTRGLTARYFGNSALSSQPALERIDPAVSFTWASATPDRLLPADGFSVRWSGQLGAPSSEAYTFYLYSAGGARLWVNNQIVVDRWQPPFELQTRSAPVELRAGEKVDIRVEYYDAQGDAMIRLLWSSASTPKQVIPRRHLYPEAAINGSASAAPKQSGTLLPPGSAVGPKAIQPSAPSQWLTNSFGRAALALFIACGVSALLLRARWRQVRRRVVLSAAGVVSRLRDKIAWLAGATCIGIQKLAGLLLEIVRTAAGGTLSLWRNSGVARLTPILRRALVVALIVRLAVPLTPAEADGLALAARVTWREVHAYVGAMSNLTLNVTPVRSSGMVVSAVSQAQQVVDLQVCPKHLVMFVGERYTLTPVAFDNNQKVVHGVGMNWSSLNAAVAGVSSFGQVEAVAVGTTAVEVQCGAASKQIPIEVRSGMRPTGSNQQADLDPTNDCAAEQSFAYVPQSAAQPQQNLLNDNIAQLDWDPGPEPGSLATSFRNAVGATRFTVRSQGGAAIPTSTQLGSYNYQFNVPAVSVGGRGISAGIGLTLNSRVWNVDNGKLTFNYVGAYPAPGWTMGYGKIIRNYNASATGDGSGVGSGNSPGDYLLVAGDGTRIRLVANYDAVANRWLHASDDGSFLQFDPRSGEIRYPDGTRAVYSSVNGCLLPTAIIGTNGGVITMTYRDYCEGVGCLRVFRHRTALSAVRDTLGRYVTFHYYEDGDYPANAAQGRPAGELAAINAPDMNGVQQEIIRVEYQPITLRYDFGSMAVDAPANNSQIQVVRRVYYPQIGKGFLFLDYSSYGMPRKISNRMAMTGAGGAITDGTETAYTTYNYTTIDPNDPYGRNQVGGLSDFPQFTRREEWWMGKTDATGAPTTTPTRYDYSRTANGSMEVATIKYVDKNCEEVTTTGTDSSQLSFGKVISVERKNSTTAATLSKQIYTYVAGPDLEVEIGTVETIDEAGQGRLMRFSYGPYGRVSNQYECGYKQGGIYQVRRRTRYDYADDQSHRDARFLHLISRVSVYDAKNNNDDADDELKAKTETTYDDYTVPDWEIESYGLNQSLYPPNHDATYDQNKVIRGNATAVTTFSKIAPEESTTRRVRYDIFGNVVKAEVSCCVKKFFGFSGVTAYSQPDWVRSGSETELNLQTNYQHNYFTGLVINETNPDGQQTDYEYDRALRRKQVILPTAAVAMTRFEQDGNGNDLLTYISQTTYEDHGALKIITSKQWFDGSGRLIRAGTGTGTAPDNYDMTATVYDGWGRVVKQSNPYLGDENGNPQAVAQFWTVTDYDELSRVVKVTLPDNQFVQTTYSGATATSGASVITTDTVGRKGKSEVDGFGRLVKVTEQNPANGALEWETSYSYNVLDNLAQVNQGGQLRIFAYDAKGRLISETTPEVGTTNYTYTNFDAVNTRTDARGVVTTYTYGQLNLPTSVSYNNVSGVAVTAPMSLTYKSAGPGKAQVETVTDGVGSESYGYDQFGRLQSSIRVIDNISYEKRYEYNTISQMTAMTYPSGKRVRVRHDDRGRLSAIDRVNDFGSVQETYLSGIDYRVDGQISSQNLGNGTTESFGYSNDRLQLTSQTVIKDGNTLLNLSYGYGAGVGQMGSGSTSGNSGQLVSVNGTINGQSRNQEFTYDNVGRLATATGWGEWARRYDYDRHGNRTAVWNAVSGGSQLQNVVLQQVAGIKTNRIEIESVSGTAFSYDAGGNVTGDGARAYTYDAEKRVVSVSGLSSENYGYDAGNRRVKKVVGGMVTHYIWEGNQVIAEYERGGAATQATGTRYYHQDRLSTRVITDGVGAVKGTTNQLPFGEEIGVSGEGEKHKFGSYERDNTGLDYAVNRHYDPRQGRFSQVDPLGMGAASLSNPQSLNLYAYCANDPVNYADPSGMAFTPELVSEGQWGSGSEYFGRGGGRGLTCYVGGLQSSCSLAFGLLQSGAAENGPLETTRWNSNLFKGQGGYEHFIVDANGNASWGYWESVTTDGKDDAGNVLWSYTGTEWHRTQIVGRPGIWKGELAFDSGVIRNFNGSIIGERPLEMQMLGPLDYIGAGEIKAGAALASVLGAGSLRALLKAAAGKTLNITTKARTAEQGMTLAERWLGKGYKEIGSGVFRSADGLRQFRMTTRDITGAHGNIGPHFNFEVFTKATDKLPLINYHVPIR